MKTKRLLSLFVALVMCLASFAVYASDDIGEDISLVSLQDEQQDIDYSEMSNWAYWNEGKEKQADLFFVCPTVDMGKDGNLNADITNEKYRQSFVGAINMELGIYDKVASVYAPYYRQATFPVYNLDNDQQEMYLSYAYEDVKNAFIYYADHTDSGKPLILAGFSQGADMVIRLMKDLFDEPKYQRRLVAAYCIGWKLTDAELQEYPHLKPAVSETDTGVIIAFNSEDKDITSSLIIGKDEKTYSINPLNWQTTSQIADKSLNLGACFTDYSGNIKEEIPNLTGAYIDDKRGALKVTDINPKDYPGKLFDDGIYHLYDYQFFFKNLQENVQKRLLAFDEKYKDRIDVYYSDEIICFDVEPVIENGRTLVPLRAIFETMGCAVNYSEQDGKGVVTARKGNDSLMLTIGENKMYFNGNEIPLDVAAKVKEGRTLVPLRAISEAFECEVHWYDDTKTIYIYPTAQRYSVRAKKLSKTITDDDGSVLIEAVAYYPAIDNYTQIPYIDEINFDYEWDAQKFIDEATSKKEDARILKKEMGKDAFVPFTYELTFEQTYNIGELSLTNHKYMYTGGAHPWKVMESRTFCISLEEELSASKVIDEESLGTSLVDFVSNLFVDKLKQIDPLSGDIYTHDYIREYIGYVQFYVTRNSIVFYFNQGEITPYALGVISVEVPYDPQIFLIDMQFNCLDEYVYEREYDKDYEWKVIAYADQKLQVEEQNTDYTPQEILSEYHPAGVHKITVKGIKKGNGGLVVAHVKEGEGIESANQLYISSFYVDENNKVTLVSEDDATYLLD